MDVSFKTALRVAALCAAGATSAWGAVHLTDIVERRAEAAVADRLAAGGFDWARAEADGTLVRVSGTAPDEATRFRALSEASGAMNPANIRDRIAIAASDGVEPPAYRLEIHRRGDAATVFGLVPKSPDDATPVAARLSAVGPGLAVTDLLSATADAAPEGWPAVVDLAVTAVQALDNVRVEATETRIAISGAAPDGETATRLERDWRAAAPEGIAVEVDLDTPRAVVTPFALRLDATGPDARFDSCVASTEAGRQRILAAATALGVPADAACPLALGAPGPAWERVAADAIGVLATLGAGTVTVSDLTVVLSPGGDVAPDAAMRAATRLEQLLPPAYRLRLPDSLARDGAGASPETPVFTATRSPEGLTLLRGTIGTPNARDVVETFAGSRLADTRLHLSLDTAMQVPDQWSVRVLAGLDAFAELDSGRLRITAESVELRGASGDPALAGEITARLAEALGPRAQMSVDVRYDAALDPVAAQPTPEDCIAEIDAIQARTKITFGPGSTDLDRDAMRIVGRIADVLRDCGDVEVEITGHTDSQGRAEMNRTLSEARAIAVLEALIAERVLASTLTATGYGETRPVADNDTAEGREANRRIEFRLKYPLQGPPPAPEPGPAETDTPEDTDGPD